MEGTFELTGPPPGAPDPSPSLPERPPRWRPDGEEHPLAPEWVTVSRLSGLIWAGILSVVALGVLSILLLAVDGFRLPTAIFLWALVTFGVATPALLWPPLAYRHRSYRFDDEGLLLRRGVIWRSQIAVPRSRIQHTDVSQGPLERSFGLATLTVHTAGNHYAAVSLPGIAHDEALAVRDFLLEATTSEGRDAV